MRQTQVGGDRLFVDYAGDTMPVIVDRLTGGLRKAQIFIAVMGASSFTYVEATWTTRRSDRRPHAPLQPPRLIVFDNAKVAVIEACLYEPQVNGTRRAADQATPAARRPRSRRAC